jgi:hypothetical protein
MSELYDRIVNERSGMGKLFASLPGFKGYLDKAARRTADRMLRDYIAEQLAGRINRLASIEKTILNNGGLTHMAKTSSLKNKLQIFHDRVKTATPGYSGFFAAVKIEEDELEKLYAFDEAQVRYLDRLNEGLDSLNQAAAANEGIDAAADALDVIATEANQAFALREEVITNLDKTLGA